MQTFPEQISSMTRAPIEAQLELFGSLAMASVENAGRLAQFQIDASRTAVDQTCAAWRQLLAAGPQGLFAAMAQAQSSMAGLMRAAPEPAQDRQRDSADAGAYEQPPAAAQGASSEALAPTAAPADSHAPQPPALRTPIAEAASQVVPDGPSATPIVAAPIHEESQVSLPKVKPLEAAPPPPTHSHGIRQRKGLPRK